jgi:hypothetical protein
MNTFLTIYSTLKTKVAHIFSVLKLSEREHPQGRKPTRTNSEAVTCAILKQTQNIATKKSLYEIIEPSCKYNAFVRAINQTGKYLARIIAALLSLARRSPHLVKFTDSTDIPVCLPKNGKRHKTMAQLAAWSKNSKGSFFGLKLHLSADLDGKVLALAFTPGNADDRKIFRKMNQRLKGIFVADAGYISQDLEREFFTPNERILITATRSNMKKLTTPIHIALLNLRMRVEIHFRILKLCFGLVTSFPRSIDGYLTHYLSSIVAYLIAESKMVSLGFFCSFSFEFPLVLSVHTQTALPVGCFVYSLQLISIFKVF